MNPKIPGLKAQFAVMAASCKLTLLDFRPALPNFRPELENWIAVNAEKKPWPKASDPVRVPNAFAHLDIPVSRSSGARSIPETAVRDFCRSNEGDFTALCLAKGEFVRFTGNSVQLHAAAFDIQKMKARVAVLRRIFERSSAPIPVLGCWSEQEFKLRVGRELPNGGLVGIESHQFGGRLEHPARCPACGEPASLVLRLQLGDALLPKNTLGRPDLPILWCQDCGDWGPLFFDLSNDTPVPINGAVTAKNRAKFSQFDLEARAVSLAPVPAGKSAGRKSKAGGAPTWIQTEEIPECPKCKQGMTFVLQLASSAHIGFCDMGMLYAFVCPDCKVGATLIQSH